MLKLIKILCPSVILLLTFLIGSFISSHMLGADWLQITMRGGS